MNARKVACGTVGVGFGTTQRRDRLLDDRALQLDPAGEVAEYRAARRNTGRGLVHAGAIITVVDPE
jgi:hypothetical protein